MSQNLGIPVDDLKTTKEPYQRIAEIIAEDTLRVDFTDTAANMRRI